MQDQSGKKPGTRADTNAERQAKIADSDAQVVCRDARFDLEGATEPDVTGGIPVWDEAACRLEISADQRKVPGLRLDGCVGQGQEGKRDAAIHPSRPCEHFGLDGDCAVLRNENSNLERSLGPCQLQTATVRPQTSVIRTDRNDGRSRDIAVRADHA